MPTKQGLGGIHFIISLVLLGRGNFQITFVLQFFHLQLTFCPKQPAQNKLRQ